MLTSVPTAINRMLRNVVLNHPNSFNCQVFRKTVTRAAPVVSGAPTLGGMGVMSSEDEEQIEYAWVGNGYALQAESFQASAMMEQGDANNGSGTEFRLLVEPEEPTGMPGNFIPQKNDVVYLLLGVEPGSPKIAFEIVGIEAVLNIPPFCTRFIANRRDDLHIPAGG